MTSPWLRRFAGAVALLLGWSVGAMPPAGAGAERVTAPLTLDFDNGERLRPGGSVENVTGRGRGVVRVGDGGRLERRRHGRGWAAKYPCRDCGRALVEVADRRALDPGERRFRFGVRLRIPESQGGRYSNLLQKGYHDQAGGQYKLQVDRGRPACVVSGSAGRVVAQARRSLADGTWHRVSCVRGRTAVVLRVDGVVRRRSSGATGWLSNTAPVRVGGKHVDHGDNDQFHGRIDDVVVRVVR